MSKGNSLRVPMFLTASTPDELVRLMLSNNLKKSREHNYFDIGFNNGIWICWYYDIADIKNSIKKSGDKK